MNAREWQAQGPIYSLSYQALKTLNSEAKSCSAGTVHGLQDHPPIEQKFKVAFYGDPLAIVAAQGE